MPYISGHFADSLIFIYDSKNNLITRTTITAHNRDEMYIEVSEGLEKIKPRTRLQLLIIHSTGASELSGFLNSVRQGIYEISIYGERQREVRSSARRTLNASALISDMVTDSTESSLSEPIPVTIENMSTTGILIKTRDARFDIGSLLQVEFSISGKNVILFGEVVREDVRDAGTSKYGCKLYFLE